MILSLLSCHAAIIYIHIDTLYSYNYFILQNETTAVRGKNVLISIIRLYFYIIKVYGYLAENIKPLCFMHLLPFSHSISSSQWPRGVLSLMGITTLPTSRFSHSIYGITLYTAFQEA